MSIARTLSLFSVGCLVAAASAGGCATNDDDPAEPADAARDTQQVDSDSDESDTKDSSTKDAAKKDSGPKDSGIKDAGYQDTGAEGTACPVGVTSEKRYCGWCGTDERVCIDNGSGGSVWGPWGGCTNSKETTPGGCDPYVAHAKATCGNCGSVSQTCITPGLDGECSFLEDPIDDCVEPLQPGTTEPACKPNDVRFTPGASCTGANEGRTQTCTATCAWGTFSSTCSTAPLLPLSIDISGTVKGTTTKTFTFDPKVQTGLLDDSGSNSCPNTVLATEPRIYQYISIRNTSTKTATVSVWAAGPNAPDTVMAWYASPSPPNTVAQREACNGETIDLCDDIAGETTPADCVAELRAPADRLTIPPNGAFVTLYHQMFYDSLDAGESYSYALTVRTDALK